MFYWKWNLFCKDFWDYGLYIAVIEFAGISFTFARKLNHSFFFSLITYRSMLHNELL